VVGMVKDSIDNFEIVGFDKISNEVMNTFLAGTIEKHKQGAMVMVELPTEKYFLVNVASVRYFTDNGFEGIYVSFQRPYNNIHQLFEEHGINTDKLLIIDCATMNSGVKPAEKKKCINISSAIDTDTLGKMIFGALKDIKSSNKFIIIDSLTTLALYKSESEITKLSDILVDKIRANDFDNVVLLFNVAEDLSDKEFIKDITSHADEVINVLNSAEKYTREVIDPSVLT